MSSVRLSLAGLTVLFFALTSARADQQVIEIQTAEDVQVQVEIEEAPIRRGLGRIRLIAPQADTKEAVAEEKKEEGKADEKKDKEEEEPVRPPAPPVDPQEVRIHLLDGSNISGKLTIKEIHVETQFGKLTIPIGSILSFRPGLESFPEVAKKIDDQITALGSQDYNEREAAQKSLASMGVQIRKLLNTRLKGETEAERVRRLKQLLEAMEETGDDEEEGAPQEWIQLDTIVTTDFTVVGRIVEKKFAIGSKFGDLTVNLADVKRAERSAVFSKEDLRKTVSVEGSNIAQRNFKNTRIKLEVGDRVEFKAEGTITMTPWGSQAMCTPDGSPNYGWYMGQEMAAGCLVGKVGDNGPIFKIGSKNTYTVKKAGYLYLGIGMNPSYANQAFPGKYDVKVTVKPKS